MIGPLGENRPAGRGFLGRRGHAARPVGFHQCPPVGFLVVGNPHHEHLHVDAEQRAGEGQRGTPLPGTGFSGDARDPGFLVVERLGHGGVGLMAAGWADALVLVVDARRGAERLFQPAGTIQRAGPPLPVDVPHRLWNFDVPFGGDFLLDQRHGEQWRQIVRADRLQGTGVQYRRRRRRQIGDQIVPIFRHPVFVEQVFDGFAHRVLFAKNKGPPVRRRAGCGQCGARSTVDFNRD